MMVCLYAGMLATLFFGWRGKEKLALGLCLLTLILLLTQFSWDIYSPEYGFSMPWISL